MKQISFLALLASAFVLLGCSSGPSPEQQAREADQQWDAERQQADFRKSLTPVANSGQQVKLGNGELIRVVVRRTNFDKIAHKIDKMGDYKPEIIYENAGIAELDPRDESAIAKLNAERSPRFVTVRGDVDLEVIPAFRLLAARLHSRHPILLKDTLGCAMANDEPRMTNEQPDASLRGSGFVIPSSLDIRHSSFKMMNAFTLEANPVSPRVGRSFPGDKIDSVMLAKDLLSACPGGWDLA